MALAYRSVSFCDNIKLPPARVCNVNGRTGERHTLFSHLRSSFLLPRSYMRRSRPTLIKRRPWNGHMLVGDSSMGVCGEELLLDVSERASEGGRTSRVHNAMYAIEQGENAHKRLKYTISRRTEKRSEDLNPSGEVGFSTLCKRSNFLPLSIMRNVYRAPAWHSRGCLCYREVSNST